VFDALVIGPVVSELIAAGWLSRFVVYAPERLVDLKGTRTVAGDYAIGDLAQRMSAELVLEDAVTEYRQRLDGGSAIAFCTTIAHSYLVARRFRAAGIRAQHLDGDTPSSERRRLIAALATGEVQIVCNCGLIAEGLDIPSVAGVILLRRPSRWRSISSKSVGPCGQPPAKHGRSSSTTPATCSATVCPISSILGHSKDARRSAARRGSAAAQSAAL
jgi:superfamily II DNA or RNA helicase